ncbi:MAG: hypothetical protein JW999_07870 [Methanotrichaceae archaeon]|nr:hypothetical protein [Methanotrichaceae archaeon]
MIDNILKLSEKKKDCGQKNPASLRGILVPVVLTAALIFCIAPSPAAESGAPIPPEKFSDDYYKVYGTPDLTVSLEQARVYQGEQTSLFLTLTNRGRITSFQVNEEPAANKREEILAAQREQELEKQRTIAQDVSIRLLAENESAIDIKRAVAFPGNIREGQTSTRLEFPLEAYKNARPGQYRLFAIANYTYQRDVAVKGDEDRPESPDVFYWYDSLGQAIPITLTVERRSDVQFAILDVSPFALAAGSQDNVIEIGIKNVGSDTARDLVARLRPESGLYVSVDESPIPALLPGQEAELIFKLDVSKDAVPGKRYQLRVLFEFSDSYRDDLSDWENAYLIIEPQSTGRSWAAVLLLVVLAAGLIVIIKRRGKS